MKARAAVLAAGVLLLSQAGRAHHSIAGVYDSSRPATLDGVVAQFHFVNPHPYVLVDVADRAGAVRQWRVEMDNRSELAAIGMTAGTLKQGDRVIVTGSLARSQPNSLYVRRLERAADGFTYEQVGSSPRIATRPAP
jgi:hypothetical protein